MSHNNRIKHDDPRQCYVVFETQFDQHGFIPSLVTENEQGHCPMMGQGKYPAPWYWGETLERAQEVCERVNRERFHISKNTAERIVLSSLFPHGKQGQLTDQSQETTT